MKKLSTAIFLLTCLAARSQQIDSIYFHLYTDSLKKGVHNYINVDGRLHDGRWLPLTAKEIEFSADAGRFEGNDLILPAEFEPQKIKVKAILRASPAIFREITIWIKVKPDDELLPPVNQGRNATERKNRKNRKF